ncbi:MAG: transcription antitermination factor NusB [Clostridia bacterium]|jgi:N utilization substance protein B|nr:transcription antitermination factor NusB [Clostridia bacterium]
MRNEARENAFKLIFEGLFHECDVELSKDNLVELKKEDDIEFFNAIMTAFEENQQTMQQEIENNLKNYSYSRVFKVDLALIYLALTEIKYCQTPKAVAINEVLEIAKKYSTEKSSKFINGLISAIINEK